MTAPQKSPPAKRGRGRPAHQPTAATKAKVSVAAGGGMRHQDIAIALGISVDTLTRHYQAELSVGAAVRRLEVLQGLHKAAKKGSSSAARLYLEHEPAPAAPPEGGGAGPRVPAAVPAAAPAPVEAPKGKKEQAAADAVTAHVGTDWDDLLRRPQSAPNTRQ